MVKAWSPNQGTTKEFPALRIFLNYLKNFILAALVSCSTRDLCRFMQDLSSLAVVIGLQGPAGSVVVVFGLSC